MTWIEKAGVKNLVWKRPRGYRTRVEKSGMDKKPSEEKAYWRNYRGGKDGEKYLVGKG